MGLSKLVNLDKVLKTFCRTLQYISLKVVSGACILGCTYDFWSLGIILYILLSGLMPFSEDRKCGLNLRFQILQANFMFYPSLFKIISLPSKYLITYLLKICLKERLSVDEILRHTWLWDRDMLKRVEALLDTQRRTKRSNIVEDGSTGRDKRKQL